MSVMSIQATTTPLALGLCATCDHAQGCVFRGLSSRPVSGCEEFRAPARPPAPPPPGRRLPQLTSLCGDCANEAGCTYRRSGADPWRCEDYA